MKKIISLGLIFTFSFGLIGSVLAIAPEVENEDAGRPTKSITGSENAENRINKTMEKIKGMDLGDRADLKGLENALRNILKKQKEECLEIPSGLEFEDEGEGVQSLQKALREGGYYKGKGFYKEDYDSYGWNTAKAVYDFQKEEGIKLSDFKEKMGFKLSEKTRTKLNEEYECEEKDEEYEEEEDGEDEEDEDEWDEEKEGEVVEKCEKDEGECGWVSTNCCSENAGANWECANKEETDLECPEDVVCPQVVSPKPSTSCVCEDGECEETESEEEGKEEIENDTEELD